MVRFSVDTPTWHEPRVVSYRLQVQDSAGEPLSVCRRRYSDFLTLRSLLLEDNPSLNLVRLPKEVTRETADEVAATLERVCNSAAVYPSVLTSEPFQTFVHESYEDWLTWVEGRAGGSSTPWEVIDSPDDDGVGGEGATSAAARAGRSSEAIAECFDEVQATVTRFGGETAVFRAWFKSRFDDGVVSSAPANVTDCQAEAFDKMNELTTHIRTVAELLAMAEKRWLESQKA